jgi:hypothetical protein
VVPSRGKTKYLPPEFGQPSVNVYTALMKIMIFHEKSETLYPCVHTPNTHYTSASARISKGQGYQVFLKEKGREQFWPKKDNLHLTRKNLKNGQNFTPFRVNNMCSLKF